MIVKKLNIEKIRSIATIERNLKQITKELDKLDQRINDLD
jgi:hypothetical protein